MHIAQMLDTLYWGGAQRMQISLVETLRPLGIDITVIDLSDSSDSTVPHLLKKAGANVVSFPFNRLFSPREFFKLTLFLRAQRFDLLHTYLTYSNIVGCFAGKLAQTPVIASVRNADFQYREYSQSRKILETFALKYLATRIMPNGNVVAEHTRQRIGTGKFLDIICNAVDFAPFLTEVERSKLRIELMGDENRFLILSVGRLSPAKGFFDLLDAFLIVQNKFPSAHLVIAGGGDMYDELKSRINKLGLKDHVSLLGTRDDTLRLMVAADVYVNSSYWEGTPVSVLEAMASGLPIVATNVGENPYLLGSDSGLLVSPKSPEKLASALSTFLESPLLRIEYGHSALERVKTCYSRDTWRHQLLDLYSNITPKALDYLNK
jgi:glycosyltransferase involved in cell wall biosynthesis